MTFWSVFEIVDHVASRGVGVAGRGRADPAGLDAGVVDFGLLGEAGADLVVGRRRSQQRGDRPAGQGALFAAWRHHAVFTDSGESMLATEATHRDHAIVEQVIADLKAGPLAHMPSGQINANGAWTVLAAIAFNLTRAAGTLASRFYAKATIATIRAQLITLPARIARSARRTRIHLPRHWPLEHLWPAMFTAACGPPTPAT